jgi:hypothetical protein
MGVDGVEDPAAGMQIIQRSLRELYAEERTENDIVAEMPSVMDRALAGSACPFQTYKDSLIAFARANYALRLENGRCGATDQTECTAGYFDPKNAYIEPFLTADVDFSGGTLVLAGAIAASYGMDFVEVNLDAASNDGPLTVEFEAEEPAEFNVQIWKLNSGEGKPRALTVQPEAFQPSRGNAQVYVVPRVETTRYNQLALIITRLDGNETAGSTGSYNINLSSSG